MCKTIIINELLDIISDVTEIETGKILSKNRTEEVVNARSMFIYILNQKYNMTAQMIHPHINQTYENTLNHIKNFDNRIQHNNMLRIYYDTVMKKL
jgi:chromosomal replication initiation ATPase DnaA